MSHVACECRPCAVCRSEAPVVCGVCRMCTRCHEHAPGCAGCQGDPAAPRPEPSELAGYPAPDLSLVDVVGWREWSELAGRLPTADEALAHFQNAKPEEEPPGLDFWPSAPPTDKEIRRRLDMVASILPPVLTERPSAVCQTCRIPEHDQCSLTPGCPCCAQTAADVPNPCDMIEHVLSIARRHPLTDAEREACDSLEDFAVNHLGEN